MFESIEEEARGKHCAGMAGILEEGKDILSGEFEDSALDACLIAAAQRVEHYEMAAYGTLVAWANVMGHTEAAGMLEEILEEEKAADEKLTALAQGGINQAASEGAMEDDDEEGEGDDEEAEEEPAPAPVKSKSAGGDNKAGAKKQAAKR